MKILFVCTGNICRSPMAEVIFENMCKKDGRKDIVIKGAGTGAQIGEEMTPEAKEALKICGEQVSHRARPSTKFNHYMLGAYDYIITMTHRHAEFIGKHHNVYCLDDLTGCGDVPDPYMYPIDTYVNVCKQLQSALQILYKKIVKGAGK